MDKEKRQRRDRLQNLLIVLLSVSAIFLFALTQAELLHWDLLPDAAVSESGGQESGSVSRLQELDWPVTLVISEAGGDRRYQQLATSDSTFTAVERLWEDALRQAQSPQEISAADFQAALELPGLYASFPAAVPACILAARLGLASDEETPVQRLLLTAEESGAALLFSSGERCWRCETPLSAEELTTLAGQLGGESCLFAFEQEEESTLHPLTVLPSTLPQVRELSAAAGSAVTEELLNFFGFNSHTTSRYTDAAGTEVIVESPRRLSVTAAGLVSYLGAASYAPESFCLSDAAEPTLTELVDGAYGLLLQLPGLSGGEERLYLSDIRQESGSCTLCFSYMAGGLPIIAADGSAAAELTITDGIVTQLSLRLCSYTAAESLSLLLPVTQAAAIAAEHPGLEMALSYVDSGAAHAAASWLMR